MMSENPKPSKSMFQKLYVRVAAITGIVGTLLLAISQFEEVENTVNRIFSFVSNVAEEVYYESDETRNDLATQLLKDAFPTLTPCNVNSNWIEIANQPSLSQLLVNYQQCLDTSHCEEHIKMERDACISYAYLVPPLKYAVFSKNDEKHIYAGEFQTRGPYSEVSVIGPFIVLYDRSDDQEFVHVFQVLDGELAKCGGKLDGGAYESEVSYSKETGLLEVKSVDGLYSVSSQNCALQRIELPKEITPSNNVTVLEISNVSSGYPKVLLGGAVVPIEWRDGHGGAEGVGEVAISPTARIVTKNRCEFKGFQPFLGDMKRGFLLSETNNEAEVSNIDCYSSDVDHNEYWYSVYSWHLVLSVIQ